MARELISVFGPDASDEEIYEAIMAAVQGRVEKHAQHASIHRQGKVSKHGDGSHDESSHGNWADGSGGGSAGPSTPSTPPGSSAPAPRPPDEDPALVSETYTSALRQAGQRMAFIQAVAGTEQMSIPGERRGIDTMGIYGEWEGSEFLGWTPERLEIQRSILERMQMEQIVANDGRLPKQERQVIVMAGLPGSGKTFLVRSLLREKFDTRDFVTVNADAIKEHLVALGDIQIEDLEGMELSSMVHEESSHMAKAWERSLEKSGTNMILDITAAKKEKTLARIKRLQESGYTVHVVHADISIDEAVASATRRAVDSSPAPGKLGRIAPEPFIRSMKGTTDDAIEDAFPEYAQSVNGSAWSYRNYPISRQAPVVMYERIAKAFRRLAARMTGRP